MFMFCIQSENYVNGCLHCNWFDNDKELVGTQWHYCPTLTGKTQTALRKVYTELSEKLLTNRSGASGSKWNYRKTAELHTGTVRSQQQQITSLTWIKNSQLIISLQSRMISAYTGGWTAGQSIMSNQNLQASFTFHLSPFTIWCETTPDAMCLLVYLLNETWHNMKTPVIN